MEDVKSKRKQSVYGVIAIAAGGFILFMVHQDPSGAKAPLWVVDAAASTFLFAGLSIVATGFGLPLIGKLCGLACTYALAAPGLWMLFDGQGAQCSASIAIGGLSAASGAASGLCRAAFGIGGILTLFFALLLTWIAFRKPHQPQS
ncbi:MAG: hypothetical protein ABL866_08835 [Devosia sp.]